ncbi:MULTISPECIES: DUF4926 domain-containing protein [Eikenella]|uniref:DUF4926 domain-containing protein n=1 Tax=Eikenella longinqua TaxID=1795827 RepID=A0A1A9RXY1_9NEIS|nr:MULTISPECIES: DUF4926 domain-containing protein [Eikenella]OAM28387.1 hypothetical protein A7P95_05350 [Eikenella longinqua]
MREYRLLDVVRLKRDWREHGLRAGSIGTVVDVYGRDAYEVEFANQRGETLALLVLHAPRDFEQYETA